MKALNTSRTRPQAAVLCAVLLCAALGLAKPVPGDELDIDHVVKMIVDSVGDNDEDVHIPVVGHGMSVHDSARDLDSRGIITSLLQQDEEFIEEGEKADASKKEYEHGYQDGYEDAASDLKHKGLKQEVPPPPTNGDEVATQEAGNANKELQAAKEAKDTVVNLMQDVKEEISNDFTRVSASLENKMVGFEKKVDGEVKDVQAQVAQLKAAQAAAATKVAAQSPASTGLRGARLDTLDLEELASVARVADEARRRRRDHRRHRRHHYRRGDDEDSDYDDDDDDDYDDDDEDDDRDEDRDSRRINRHDERDRDEDESPRRSRKGSRRVHAKSAELDERSSNDDDREDDRDDDRDEHRRRHRRSHHSDRRDSARHQAKSSKPSSTKQAASSPMMSNANALAALDSAVISRLDKEEERTAKSGPAAKAQ